MHHVGQMGQPCPMNHKSIGCVYFGRCGVRRTVRLECVSDRSSCEMPTVWRFDRSPAARPFEGLAPAQPRKREQPGDERLVACTAHVVQAESPELPRRRAGPPGDRPSIPRLRRLTFTSKKLASQGSWFGGHGFVVWSPNPSAFSKLLPYLAGPNCTRRPGLEQRRCQGKPRGRVA